MCMEGIEHNPVVYELMSEMAFRDKKVQVKVYPFPHFTVLYCFELLIACISNLLQFDNKSLNG